MVAMQSSGRYSLQAAILRAKRATLTRVCRNSALASDPASPVSRGRLCPKGSASFELLTHPARLDKVRYRRPRGTEWEELDLETAMDRIADRVWDARERTFEEERDGRVLMHTTAVAHIGGATLDIEENYLIKKLFTAGLGMVCLSNQARI